MRIASHAAFLFSAMQKFKILAERDGRSHEFTPEIWNALPQHKYGWKEISRPVPTVVRESISAGPKAESGKKSGTKKKSETTDIV